MIYILLISISAFAQQKDSIMIKNRAFYVGRTYLDSTEVDLSKFFLNPKNIISVNKILAATSKAYSTTDGVTFITRKKKDKLVPLTEIISSVRSSNKIPENETVHMIVDGALVENPDGYFIEQSFIKKIAILKDDPKLKGDHLYREPTISITTKGKKKK